MHSPDNTISISHHCSTYKRSSTLSGHGSFSSSSLTFPPAPQYSHTLPHLPSDGDYSYAIAIAQSCLQRDEVLGGRCRGCRCSHQTQKTRHYLNGGGSVNDSASESGYSPSRSLRREKSERLASFVSNQRKTTAIIFHNTHDRTTSHACQTGVAQKQQRIEVPHPSFGYSSLYIESTG